MSAAEDAAPVSAAQAEALFRPLVHTSALILAVSGGPDSTALLMLAARWRAALRKGPALLAVTVDHGLRRESAAEARAVEATGAPARRAPSHLALARQEAGRPACRKPRVTRAIGCSPRRRIAANARCILTAHTLDDQAETVLFRMMRGSGLTGLGAMTQVSLLPASAEREIMLVRPLLDIPKTRLVATLDRCQGSISRAIPRTSIRDLRVRGCANLMPALAREGLDARRLAILARRLRRAEAAIEMAVGVAAAALSEQALERARPDRIRCREDSTVCPPKWHCGCWRGRSPGSATRDRSNSARSRRCSTALGSAATNPQTARLRRTLAGAQVTLGSRPAGRSNVLRPAKPARNA